MLSQRNLCEMARIIQRHRELAGVPVGYYDGIQCTLIDRGTPMSQSSGVVGVAIEEAYPTARTQRILRPHQSVVVDGAAPELTNGSRLGSEALNAGLTCGFTAISAFGIYASAAGEIPTLGATTPLFVASLTGFLTSSYQCGDGIIRTMEALSNPNGRSLAQLDGNPLYRNTVDSVDAVGIVAGLPGAVSTANSLLRRETGRLLSAELAGYLRDVGNSNSQGAIRRVRQGTESALQTWLRPRPAGRLNNLPAPGYSDARPSVFIHVFNQAGQSTQRIN